MDHRIYVAIAAVTVFSAGIGASPGALLHPYPVFSTVDVSPFHGCGERYTAAADVIVTDAVRNSPAAATLWESWYGAFARQRGLGRR